MHPASGRAVFPPGVVWHCHDIHELDLDEHGYAGADDLEQHAVEAEFAGREKRWAFGVGGAGFRFGSTAQIAMTASTTTIGSP